MTIKVFNFSKISNNLGIRSESSHFANKTITALGPGGGALIPGVHANQGGRPGMTYRASKVADASSAGGSTGQHGSPGALG